jgi:radical SAM superfamily enzyme YgiQ (UPF0313 family)
VEGEAMGERLRTFGVVPPTGRYVREDRCQATVKNLKTVALRPPIDLTYAAAAFEAAGAESRVADYPAQGGDWDTFARDLRTYRPHLVLLSVTTQTLAQDLRAATLAKEIDPAIRVFAKGAHFNVHDVDTVTGCGALDGVLRGEIEETCVALGRVTPPSEILGLTWRAADGTVVRNPDRPFPTDLDALPFPARHLIDNGLYVRPDTGAPQASIVTNRGCPFHCTYGLASQTAGTRNRYRTVENVVAEIRECVERHGITSFLFRSDLFTQNKPWVIRLCQAILDEKLRIDWACNARADCVDAELLRWMRRAGCWIVAFGVESGDQAVLDRIDKRATVADAYHAVALCRQLGIKTSVYLTMGFPWDTPASIRRLSAFARDLDPDVLEIFFPYPFPGTPLRRDVVAQGLLGEDEYPVQSYDMPAFATERFSIAALAAARRRVLRRFYLRPRKIARTLGATRSLGEFGNYVRVGLSQLRLLLAPAT